MANLEVVEFYNDRGDSKRLFDETNNDFLWEKMPFSFLHENTVILVMMAICRNLYHFLTNFISKKLNFIKPTFRLKKFIFRFMVVSSKWITKGRQQILRLLNLKKTIFKNLIFKLRIQGINKKIPRVATPCIFIYSAAKRYIIAFYETVLFVKPMISKHILFYGTYCCVKR